MDRDHYFYLPGTVLHIDGDKNYLNRCMDLYKNMNISAYGLVINEREISSKIMDYLNEIRPDVLVITGHDAYYDSDDENSYKNSSNFIKAVKTAREYERDHDKLIIVAGACQSDYESLIKAGANFASSPKRINIHALDPAIIASSVCLSRKSEPIDLMKILSRTKYGKDGIGGIITNGTMYVGYPR
jgi:spore coat assembly protein